MITGVSKFLSLGVATLLQFAGIMMVMFTILAPVLVFNDELAFLTVKPSQTLTHPGSASAVDGPSIFMGVLGSCARSSNEDKVQCTKSKLNPKYDTSVLPTSAPGAVLTPPTIGTPIVLIVALSMSALFLITYATGAFSHKMGDASRARFQSPGYRHFSVWFGFLGLIIGLATFLVMRLWFGKTVIDFNGLAKENGTDLIAATGNAFILVYISYGFFAIPLVISLVTMQVRPPPEE